MELTSSSGYFSATLNNRRKFLLGGVFLGGGGANHPFGYLTASGECAILRLHQIEEAQMPWFYVEFENDDVGPFESRELAEMYGAMEAGDDFQVFTTSTPRVRTPIRSMFCNVSEKNSRNVAYHLA